MKTKGFTGNLFSFKIIIDNVTSQKKVKSVLVANCQNLQILNKEVSMTWKLKKFIIYYKLFKIYFTRTWYMWRSHASHYMTVTCISLYDAFHASHYMTRSIVYEDQIKIIIVTSESNKWISTKIVRIFELIIPIFQ